MLPIEIVEAIAEAGYEVPQLINPYKKIVGRQEVYDRIKEDATEVHYES